MSKRLSRLIADNWLFLVIVCGLVAGFLLLRTEASAVSSADQMDALLHDGQPTLVELYSNT